MNKPLFIFEFANNHMGDPDHASKMISEYADIIKDYDFDFGDKAATAAIFSFAGSTASSFLSNITFDSIGSTNINPTTGITNPNFSSWNRPQYSGSSGFDPMASRGTPGSLLYQRR